MGFHVSFQECKGDYRGRTKLRTSVRTIEELCTTFSLDPAVIDGHGLVFRVEGLVFRVEGLVFRVEGLVFRVEGLVFRVEGLAFRVEGLVFRVEGLVFRVEGLVCNEVQNVTGTVLHTRGVRVSVIQY